MTEQSFLALGFAWKVKQGIFLSLYDGDIFKAYLWYDVSAEDLRIQNFTAGDLNLNPYGGNLGIGTDGPGAKLELAEYH